MVISVNEHLNGFLYKDDLRGDAASQVVCSFQAMEILGLKTNWASNLNTFEHF